MKSFTAVENSLKINELLNCSWLVAVACNNLPSPWHTTTLCTKRCTERRCCARPNTSAGCTCSDGSVVFFFVDNRGKGYWHWHVRGWKLWIKTTTSGLSHSAPSHSVLELNERLFSGAVSQQTSAGEQKKSPSLVQVGIVFPANTSFGHHRPHLVIGPLVSKWSSQLRRIELKQKDPPAGGALKIAGMNMQSCETCVPNGIMRVR